MRTPALDPQLPGQHSALAWAGTATGVGNGAGRSPALPLQASSPLLLVATGPFPPVSGWH